MERNILVVSDKKEEKILRTKTKEFDFASMSKRDITALIERMKKTMRGANGVGLSANQIGLSLRIFVAEVPDGKGGMKFYAVFNPKIEKFSTHKVDFEEGCLSVPGSYGNVRRPETIVLKGYDKNGKALKIKAWGLLARVFQHEMGHLNGELFIDKADHVHEIPLSDRLQKREEKMRT